MFKKFLKVMTSLVLVFTLCACGSSKSDTGDKSSSKKPSTMKVQESSEIKLKDGEESEGF